MNNVDKQYLDLLQDILDNGVYKETRSGAVRSVFGRMMRFNLQDGLPILTTKKVFTRGIIHELLWFLSGDTNIKYLTDNNVHIWDDDAYRFFKTFNIQSEFKKDVNKYTFEITGNNTIIHLSNIDKVNEYRNRITKDDFLKYVQEEYHIYAKEHNRKAQKLVYTFGDMGPIYGHEWTNWRGVDQIKNLIETLKTNPNDRRMIVSAWNVDEIPSMGLPPCHYVSHFYTRPLNNIERLDWLCKHSNGKYDEWKSPTTETLDKLNVPKYELSCSFSMRSNDFCCGNPFNIAQYSIFTHMIAQCVNMAVGELIYYGEDVHIYENHLEQAQEQLTRNPHKYNLPKLWLNPEITDIDNFKFEDIKIIEYESYPAIKYTLNVGF